MKYNQLKLVELKKIAKEKNIKGYSKLNKENLIILLNNFEKLNKMKGGDECRHTHVSEYEEITKIFGYNTPFRKTYYKCNDCKKISKTRNM